MPSVRVGLTGGIGSGKSTVAGRFRELGGVVLDADQAAREVVEPGTPGLAAVRIAFGADVLLPDGRLDRAALGSLVFGDEAALTRLNDILHPLIAARTAELVAALPQDAVLVHDVALLVENGLTAGYDLVVVVFAPEAERVRRLVQNRGMSQREAVARIRAQATDEQRRAVADVWIDNSADLEPARAQVDACWHDRIQPLRASWNADHR